MKIWTVLTKVTLKIYKVDIFMFHIYIFTKSIARSEMKRRRKESITLEISHPVIKQY